VERSEWNKEVTEGVGSQHGIRCLFVCLFSANMPSS
jgi:hypothetical protein